MNLMFTHFYRVVNKLVCAEERERTIHLLDFHNYTKHFSGKTENA